MGSAFTSTVCQVIDRFSGKLEGTLRELYVRVLIDKFFMKAAKLFILLVYNPSFIIKVNLILIFML